MDTNFEELMSELSRGLSFSNYDVFVFVNRREVIESDRKMYNFKMRNAGVFETNLKRELVDRLKDIKVPTENISEMNTFIEDIRNGLLNLLTWHKDNVKLTSEFIHPTGFLLTIMVSPILSGETTPIK